MHCNTDLIPQTLTIYDSGGVLFINNLATSTTAATSSITIITITSIRTVSLLQEEERIENVLFVGERSPPRVVFYADALYCKLEATRLCYVCISIHDLYYKACITIENTILYARIHDYFVSYLK